MARVICKHGNSVSVTPEFEYIRCKRCDDEMDAPPAKAEEAMTTTAPNVTDEELDFVSVGDLSTKLIDAGCRLSHGSLVTLLAAVRMNGALDAAQCARERLPAGATGVDRDAIIDECAAQIRHECVVCLGNGFAEENPLNDPTECEYCGRPMAAIRALKSSGGLVAAVSREVGAGEKPEGAE